MYQRFNGNVSVRADPALAILGGRHGVAELPPSAPRGRDEAARSCGKETDPYRMLVARPVTRLDLASLLEIASHVNLASMRNEKAKNELFIEQSTRTLAGELSWQQGLMFLGADLYPADGSPCELAGNIKLQVGWGGYWKQKRQNRLFQLPGLQTWAEHEYLVYQPNPNDDYGLELAGLSVLPRHQGKKAAQLLTDAWGLFVLLHQEELQRRTGNIAYLYANVLTADAEGKYPFYEQVVRRLFGGLEYDMVDSYRYARSNARSPILDEFLDVRGDQQRACILTHLLPESLRQDLGKVRDKSIGCQKNLERLGFSRTDRYDVLDGGQYFETTFAGLNQTLAPHQLQARCVARKDLRPGASWRTVAPVGRSMSGFRCARVRCQIQGDYLLLGEEEWDALELCSGEAVVVPGSAAPPQEELR